MEGKKLPLDIDDIIQEIRPFGLYQIILAVVYAYVECVSIGNNALMTYGGLKPLWNCNGERSPNTSELVFNDDCAIFKSCPRENLTYQVDFYSILPYWELMCDRAWYVQLITTLQMIGVLIGALLSGHISDHFGRKWTSIATIVVQIVFGSLSVLSPTWQIFAFFRFIIGLAIGGTFSVVWVLIAEFTSNQRRFLIKAIGSSPFIHCLSQTLIAYLTKHWVPYVLVSNLQGIPLVVTMLFLMESPRWLVQKGRQKEAMKVLRTLAWINRCPERMEGITLSQKEIKEESYESKKLYFWSIFRDRQLAIYCISATFLWFTVSSVYYGMVFDLGNLGANIYVSTTLLGVASLVELVIAVLDNLWGRVNRKVLTVSALGILFLSNLLVAILQLTGSSESTDARTILAVVSVIGLVADNLAFDMAYLFAAELFPTLLRNIAGSVCSVGARIGAALAPQMIYLNIVWLPLPYFSYATIALASLFVVVFLLPDTKNAKLPEALDSKVEDIDTPVKERMSNL